MKSLITHKENIIPFLTALLASRIVFLLINDPEGPNLLIVTMMAIGIYTFSLLTYKILPSSSHTRLQKIIVLGSMQLIIAGGLALCIR